MSFPKAKILRFNEEMTCAPPPGKYDPKFESKVKGAVIEKSKRFVEPKIEPAMSIESLDSASTCSHHQFRTPQLPKKKLPGTPRSAIEHGRSVYRTPTGGMTPLSKSKKKLDDVFKYETEKNLIEQINELQRVHSSQLIEKDEELNSLHNEITELKNNYSNKEDLHETEIKNLRLECNNEIKKLKQELENTLDEMRKEKIKHDDMVRELKSQISVLEENVKNSNSINSELEYRLADHQLSLIEMKNEYFALQEELKNAKIKMEKIIEEHKAELITVKDRHSEELEGIATAAELNVELVSRKMGERLKTLEAELDIERMEHQVEFTCKIEQISEEVKKKVKNFDLQATTIFENVKLMADEYDKKINDLVESLNTCTEINENKLCDYINISEELESQKAVNLEQKITIVDLQDKVDVLHNDLEKLRKQCKKYEIVQAEASKTIQVLSKRLYESESEVERLNEAQEELTLRKDALEEKIRALLNENKELKVNIADLQVTIVGQVKEVEANLVAKVDTYRRLVVDETQKFKSSLDEKQRTIEMMLGEIDFYRNKANESAEYISLYQSRISNYKDEISELSMKFNEIEDDYNDKLNAQKTLYSELLKNFENLKISSTTREEELKNTIETVNSEKTLLVKQLEGKVQAVSDLEEALKDCKQKLIKAEEDILLMEETGFEHENHIEELALKLDHYTDCAQKTTQQINNLNKEIEEKSEEINQLEQDIADKDLKIASLSAELLESKNYVQSMTEHVVQLMNELTEKDRLCENLNHEIEMKSATLIQVSEEYEKMKKLYETETKRTKEIEKEFQESHRDNEKYVDELISELVLEKERCTELTHTLEDYKLNNKKLEAVKQEDFSEIIKNYEQIEARLTEENNQLIEENKSFMDKLDEYKQNIKQLEEEKLDQELKLKEINNEKEGIVEMIKRQWEEMEMLTNEIESQHEQIDELKQARQDNIEDERAIYQAELQNEIFALQQSLNDTQKMVIQLKSREEDLVYKLKSAEADLNDAENENEIRDNKIKELDEKNSEQLSQIEALERRKNEYKAYVVEMEEEITQLKLTNNTLSEENDNLKSKCICQGDQSKYISLQERINDLETRNSELENIIGPFKEQLVQFESERAALLSKTENTEKELKALALEHAKALGHQNHKQKIKHVVHLTETICELKKEMEKLRNENAKLRQSLVEQQHKDGTLRKSGLIRPTARVGRIDKENTTSKTEATSPLSKSKERQSSPASTALKQRNGH
uniref:Putative titin isoform x6 n=1 Tax=Triatoma infestans TaxID=30076 RepID=A0A023EXJ0_TRIIF